MSWHFVLPFRPRTFVPHAPPAEGGRLARRHLRFCCSFYWVTILVSNTLGTALGDFVATTTGLGFGGGALVFAGLLAVVATAHFSRWAPGALLFWATYVLTRPLGATLGDTLTKSHADGGLAFGRITSSLALAAGMVVVIALALRAVRAPAQDPPGTPG